MNLKIVKYLLSQFDVVREVVDLATDYGVECEPCAKVFVDLVNAICSYNNIKHLCFKCHYIDKMTFEAIGLQENISTAAAHRWAQDVVFSLSVSLSLLRGFDMWVDEHFPLARDVVLH